MDTEKISHTRTSPKEGLDMYFSPEVAEDFARHEQNDKNFRVAQIVDRTIMQETKDIHSPIFAAELGGGAHPDRYHRFFEKMLQEPKGHIDWVDISPYMLRLAQKYIDDDRYEDRLQIITFVESGILEYLRTRDDEQLDLCIMKYTIDHIQDIDELFRLFSAKIKEGGKVISTINLDPELKSYSTNARFLYEGEQFPDDETRTLQDGDSFTVKFFRVSGDPQSGFIEGAETTKYFHSTERIKVLSQRYGFEVFLGDWKDFISKDAQDGETMDQEILVLTKR